MEIVPPDPRSTAPGAPVVHGDSGEHRLLEEREVTLFRLARLLKRAGIEATLDDDGDLLMRDDNHLVYQLAIDGERRQITLRSLFNFRAGTTREERLELVNRIHEQLIMARFYVSGDDLIGDYLMPYDGGLVAEQLVATVRLFMRVVPNAIIEYDEHDIVC